MSDSEKKMRAAAKKLLTDGNVDMVVGFRKGSRPGTSRPYFARSAADIDKLVWDGFCFANLAAFLPRLFEKPARPKDNYKPPRVAVTAKGCDGRSIAGLVRENQVPRANLVIIAMPCEGMYSPQKSAAAASAKKNEIARACVECIAPEAKDADICIEGTSRKAVKPTYNRVKAFAAKSPAERWKAFTKEISRCIRCNACREACPNCYCKVCFADQRKPSWVSPANELSETIAFHMGRMFHQAGRCVECDACVNACPMGIDLRLFTQKLAADAGELFGFVPGVSGGDVPMLHTFAQDDSERFITDPEEK
jgi:formate dehydrogenase (coenzyme F420) beta subunit